jgi:EpsI family protein
MTPIDRRGALIGLACAAAAGGALALEPRRRISLLGRGQLEQIVPKAFAGWSVRPSQGLVVPNDEDSLAARLYSQIVARLYVHQDGAGVMLLIAHGGTQDDLLQLHRPEVCYPAFGFALAANRLAPIELAPEARLPARALSASNSERLEQILYWTRIGEHLPVDGRSQRLAKLEDQFAGIIPDGVLVRISNLEPDPAAALAINAGFATEMVRAVTPAYRPALIGTALSGRLG